MSKVAPFMKIKWKPIMNEFKAQLKHCPLMPMFYNHKRNDKITRLREDDFHSKIF